MTSRPYLPLACMVLIALFGMISCRPAGARRATATAVAAATPVAATGARTADRGGWSTVPIQLPVQSAAVAALFNTLRPTDEALFIFEGYATAPLDSVTQGHIAYAYGSLSDLQLALPSLPSPVTRVVYNPEHGPHTPAGDQKNLVGTAAAAAAAVHATGRAFDLVPDATFTEALVSQLAPYADAYVIQAQRYQGDHAQFDRFVGQTTQAIKTAKPSCQVWIQVQVDTQQGMTPTLSPQGAWAALQTLPALPDGVGVWSFRNQVTEAQQFIELLRPSG